MRDKLIKARGRKTQKEVSNELNITQKYLSKLELGQRTPSAKLLVKISNYYNIKPEELFPDIFLKQHTTKRSCKNINNNM